MKRFYEYNYFGLVFLVGLLTFSLIEYSKSDAGQQSKPIGYPIASDVFTTLQKTVVPGPKPPVTILLDEVSKYEQYGYGNWSYGSGLPYDKRLDIMPTAYSGISVTKKTKLPGNNQQP